jgi:hypothetical protein
VPIFKFFDIWDRNILSHPLKKGVLKTRALVGADFKRVAWIARAFKRQNSNVNIQF